MCPCDNLVRIYRPRRFRRGLAAGGFDDGSDGSRGVVGFEYIKAFELLVEDSKGLEFFRLGHLRLKPSLDFILLDLFEIGMEVVNVAEGVRG